MKNFKPLTDDDFFPFGKWKGTPMSDVPATYLDWLIDQTWINEWPAVEDYIDRNLVSIQKDIGD